MKYYSVFFVIYTAFIFSNQAQTIPVYHENEMQFNPAYTGFHKKIIANVFIPVKIDAYDRSQRNKYSGIEGYLKKTDLGIGLITNLTSFALEKSVLCGLLVSYKYSINEQSWVSLGTGFQYELRKFDWSDLTFDLSDPIMDKLKPKYEDFHFNIGTAFKYQNFEIGVALNNIITTQTFDWYKPHGILSASYQFNIADKLMIKPAFVAYKYEGKAIEKFIYNTISYNRKFFSSMYYVPRSFANFLYMDFGVRYKVFQISVGREFAFYKKSHISRPVTLYYLNLRIVI